MNNRKKILIIGGVGLAALGMVILAVLSTDAPGTTTLNIVVDPSDSILTVDGVRTKPGKVTFKDGKHTLKASRELFTDTTKTIQTSDYSAGQTVYVVPAPDSPEAQEWLRDHPAPRGVRESAGAAAAADRYQYVNDHYPFLAKLPRQTLDYKIDYSLTAKNELSFFITLYPYAKPGNDVDRRAQLTSFKAKALKYLSENGVDVKKATIGYDPAEAAGL